MGISELRVSRKFLTLAGALFLSACVSAPRMPDPPTTHPASPQAAESPLPDRPWILEEKPKEEPKKEDHPQGHGQGHREKK